MSYLCAGLYAEGPTDYAFLLALLDQLLPRLAHTALPTVSTIGNSVGIDAPARTPARREERIAAAIAAYWEQCTLFVVHADGGGDPGRASREQVWPGIELAREAHPELAAAACVPVREIEAWLLADPTPFRKLVGGACPELPRDAEAVADPKQELRRVLAAAGVTKLRQDIYSFFGANVDIGALQRLPAFVQFEESLTEAIRFAARQA